MARARVSVDPAVFAMRPDFVVVALVADGLERLDPLPLEALHRAADARTQRIGRRKPHARIERARFEKG